MQFVKNLLTEQRRRLVGSLMQYLEQNVYQYLSEEERHGLRQKVLSAVGHHHDVCLDLLKASVSDGTVVNDRALQMIANLHRDVKAALHEED